jgi:hypothetical protein
MENTILVQKKITQKTEKKAVTQALYHPKWLKKHNLGPKRTVAPPVSGSVAILCSAHLGTTLTTGACLTTFLPGCYKKHQKTL